jgi:hypothetical protein
MIFIFDWGYETTENVGPLSPDDVENLLDDFMWLQKTTVWFRVFFIPLIPTKYVYSVSAVNSSDRMIISKELFLELAPLARLNKKVMNGELTDEEYERERMEI